MMHSFKWLLSKNMFQGVTKQIRNNKKAENKTAKNIFANSIVLSNDYSTNETL